MSLLETAVDGQVYLQAREVLGDSSFDVVCGFLLRVDISFGLKLLLLVSSSFVFLGVLMHLLGVNASTSVGL